MKWYEISVRSEEEIAEQLTTLFLIHGIEDLLIEGGKLAEELEGSGIRWDYLDDELQEAAGGSNLYKAHVECEESEVDALFASIQEGIAGLGLACSELKIEEIDPKKDVDNWKQYFKPFSICEGLVICPSWEDYAAKDGETVILMDPGSAFGTGTHETTALCAAFLSEYVEGDERVLDIGCGSGILSIIALLKGALFAKAVDVDELAIAATVDNANKNGLQNKIEVSSAEEDYGTDYELIVSNLTTPILLELAERIDAAAKPGSYFICSGILTVGKAELIERFEKLGFRLLEDRFKGEWTGLVFQK